MTKYEADPNANAVVLWSNTEVSFGIKPEYDVQIYRRKFRVKILTEEGLKAANITIPYYDLEETNMVEGEISEISATTFSLENGKTVTTKMTDDVIKKKQVGKNQYEITFTVPDVKVGSVIEYEYRYDYVYYLSPQPWYAQCEFPVALAEYSFCMPECFQYTARVGGPLMMVPEVKHASFKLEDMKDALDWDDDYEHRAPAIRMDFSVSNLPALVIDGRKMSEIDECVRVEHDLRGIRIRNHHGHIYRLIQVEHKEKPIFFDDLTGDHHFHYRLKDILPGGFTLRREFPAINMSFNDSWYSIAAGLIDDDSFGKIYRMKNPLAAEQAAIDLSARKYVAEKVAILRDLLFSKYKWNGEYGIFGKTKIGDSNSLDMGTMNFVLMSMLRDAGISAVPVVFSRRSKGLLPDYPSTRYLNAMCLRVKNTDGSIFYVDPTSPDCPVGMLPSELLFNKGIAVYLKVLNS